MNNKYLSFLIIGLFVFSMFGTSLVSAAGYGTEIQTFMDDAVNTISPITGFLFGDAKSTGEAGFIALMAFILTLLVVAGILSPLNIFGENKAINWGVAAIISVIGVRFISIDMLKAFTLPSTGLIGAIFLIVPFIVVATLISKAGSTAVRKAMWAVYTVIIATLWIRAFRFGEGWNGFYWIYVFILLACIAMFAFDGTLQKFFKKAKYERITAGVDSTEKRRVLAKIADLQTAKAAVASDPKEVKEIDEKIKALNRLLQ